MTTKQIQPEAAYENAHLVARDLLDRIAEQLTDMPAPEAAPIDWGHVGTVNHVNQLLSEVIAHLEDRPPTPQSPLGVNQGARKDRPMHYREAFRQETLNVTCPDGITRKIWGYNPVTGDLFVQGWTGDVWMDCSDGTLRAEFETH